MQRAIRRAAWALVGWSMLAGLAAAPQSAQAEPAAAVDPRFEGYRHSPNPFEARQRDAEVRRRMVAEQEARNRVQVPTFTIPQPYAYGRPYYSWPRGRAAGRWVRVPGHWELWFGRMVYVPTRDIWAPW